MDFAHIHLLLNHVPVLGTIFGLLLLIVAIFWKNATLTRAALGFFVLSALVALPVYLTGEPAEGRIESLPGVTESVIAPHETMARYALIAVGVLGLLSLATWMGTLRAHRIPQTALLVLLCLGLGTSALMGWTANLGGDIRHTEIRAGSATVGQVLPEAPSAASIAPTVQTSDESPGE